MSKVINAIKLLIIKIAIRFLFSRHADGDKDVRNVFFNLPFVSEGVPRPANA